jgi:catechol 2,3-dioxygenase-like lactoylglutathione lyase family enzyme
MPGKRNDSNRPTGAERMTVRAQPLIAVRDVRASSRWYAKLLGLERTSESMGSDHDHIYDRLLSAGSLVLQIHAWDEEDHPNLRRVEGKLPGHGVLLWFEVDDFDAAVHRARELKAKVLLEPHVNEAPQHREMWLEDVDGYVVVLASPDGEAGEP